MLDGHSILVTPDPVPNSEVKLDTFVPVLSLMGTYEAVYFIFLNYLVKFFVLIIYGLNILFCGR